MRIEILGTGADGGIPQIGCACDTCRLSLREPSERRLRSSIVVGNDEAAVLVDASPDLRVQLLRHQLRPDSIKAVLLTHLHFDHMIGLYEFLSRRSERMQVVSHPETCTILKSQHAVLNRIHDFIGNFRCTFDDIEVDGIAVPHTPEEMGPTIAISFFDGDTRFIYAPDISKFPEEFKEEVDGSDFLIVDGTFLGKSAFGHISVQETVRMLKNSKTKRVLFTHINHTEGTRGQISARLVSPKFQLLQDGMVFRDVKSDIVERFNPSMVADEP